jgi:hypothetical protein
LETHTRQNALSSLSSLLGGVLYINPSFYNDLAALEDIELGGSLLLDLSVNAAMSNTNISTASYSNANVNITVNRFETSAFLQSVNPFSVDMSLGVPSSSKSVTLGLTNGTFDAQIYARITSPVNLLEIFSDDQANATNLDFGGSLGAYFPLSVGVADVDIGVSLNISDSDLFDSSGPDIDYQLDICEVVNASKTLFEELTNQILEVIEAPLQNLDIGVNLDKITQPLIDKVNSTLIDFQTSVESSFNTVSCDRRMLQEGASASLKTIIDDAIVSVNAVLESLNIVLEADVDPYFNREDFSVGVNVQLSATISMTAAEMIGFVENFINNATQPEDGGNFSKTGLGDGDGSSAAINLTQLSEDTMILAGFDVTFGLDLNIGEIQEAITDCVALDAALLSGISLRIETWGAYATLVVDPINIDVTLFGSTQSIVDSYIAVSADLRSRDVFFASIQDMIDSTADTSVLIPNLSVPLSAELGFNLTVFDDVTVLPIMKLDSTNLVDGSFTFDFDVGLGAFLDSASNTFGPNTLDNVFQNVTDLLGEITNYAPDLTAGGSSSPLGGLLDLVEDFQDFVGGFQNFTDLVSQGKCIYQ